MAMCFRVTGTVVGVRRRDKGTGAVGGLVPRAYDCNVSDTETKGLQYSTTTSLLASTSMPDLLAYKYY